MIKKARVAPMMITRPPQIIENTVLGEDENDEVTKKEKERNQFFWHDVVEMADAKSKIKRRWQTLVNSVRIKVNVTKAFEEVNLLLMKDKHRLICKGSLISQCILENENDGTEPKKRSKLLRGSTENRDYGKWLIRYFTALSQITDNDQKVVDYNYLEKMFKMGVDVNCVDRHGQCVLHEVARLWHTDVAKFLLEHGSVINHPDNYGRTALHVASAVDYPEMVEFLLNNGADINVRTYEENQTAVHYAAKNDAADSLKVLFKYGGDINDLDYKQRSPLQLAAELDRSTTAEVLIEEGAPAGVYDECKMAALTVMIEKMPKIALQALDQFYSTDRANRKQFFYLNFLIPPTEGKNCYAKSPLEVAVEHKQYQLLLHPVFQQLIEVKWQRVGKWGAWFYGMLNLLVALLWTIRVCMLPIKPSEIYKKEDDTYKLVDISFDVFAVLTFAGLLISETREFFKAKLKNINYKQWKEEQLQRDLKHAHPRWPEERLYLEREIRETEEYTSSYVKDQWNCVDWVTQFLMGATIVTHVINISMKTKSTNECMRITASVNIIFMWLRLLKYARPFKMLGLFVVMLSHVITDVIKILFLSMHIFVPYIAAFWLLFGAYQVKGFTLHNGEIFYNLFQMGVVGDFGFDELRSHSEIMAFLLVGTFIFLAGIVILNLFIALLSDTFQRVYDNAKATAQMQRAANIIEIEADLGEKRLRKCNNWITKNCAPQSLYYDDDVVNEENSELKKLTHQIRTRLDDVHQLIEGNIEGNNNNGSETNRDMRTSAQLDKNSGSEENRDMGTSAQLDKEGNVFNTGGINELKMVADTLNEFKTEYYKSMIQTRAEIAGLGLMLKELIDENNYKKKKRYRKKKVNVELPELGMTKPSHDHKITNENSIKISRDQDITNENNDKDNLYETPVDVENASISVHTEDIHEQNPGNQDTEGFFEGYTFSDNKHTSSDDQLIKRTWGNIFNRVLSSEEEKEDDNQFLRNKFNEQQQKHKSSVQQQQQQQPINVIHSLPRQPKMNTQTSHDA